METTKTAGDAEPEHLTSPFQAAIAYTLYFGLQPSADRHQTLKHIGLRYAWLAMLDDKLRALPREPTTVRAVIQILQAREELEHLLVARVRMDKELSGERVVWNELLAALSGRIASVPSPSSLQRLGHSSSEFYEALAARAPNVFEDSESFRSCGVSLGLALSAQSMGVADLQIDLCFRDTVAHARWLLRESWKHTELLHTLPEFGVPASAEDALALFVSNVRADPTPECDFIAHKAFDLLMGGCTEPHASFLLGLSVRLQLITHALITTHERDAKRSSEAMRRLEGWGQARLELLARRVGRMHVSIYERCLLREAQALSTGTSTRAPFEEMTDLGALPPEASTVERARALAELGKVIFTAHREVLHQRDTDGIRALGRLIALSHVMSELPSEEDAATSAVRASHATALNRTLREAVTLAMKPFQNASQLRAVGFKNLGLEEDYRRASQQAPKRKHH